MKTKERVTFSGKLKPQVGTKLFHLFIKSKGTNKYYGSIKALIDHNDKKILGVSDSTLYHRDWKEDYENEKIVIKKDEVLTTGDVKKAKKKKR